MLRGIGDAKEMLQQELARMGCEVAPEKLTVVGSDHETARGLRRVVGAEEFPEQGGRATFLGADYAAGRRRGAWQANSQATRRIKAAWRRRGRVLRLWKAAGSRATKIAKTGLLPQSGFGVAIVGLSDAELDKLRRLQETGTGGRRRGRNMARQRLVDGDQAAAMAAEPILEWAKEWRAMQNREAGACTRGEMVSFWQASQARATKRWVDTRGPADVVRLSLRR